MSFFKQSSLIPLIPHIDVVSDYNADNTGSTDCTSAINNAISLANSTGRTIFFRPGTYRIDGTLTAITKNGVIIEGSGPEDTVFRTTNSSGDTITIQASFCSIKNLTIYSTIVKSGGNSIKLSNAHGCTVKNLYISHMRSFIEIASSNNCLIEKIHVGKITGPYGIYAYGISGNPTKNLHLVDIICNNEYGANSDPFGANPDGRSGEYNLLTTWANNKFFSKDFVFRDTISGWIWQVARSGTSASAGNLPNLAGSGSNWSSPNSSDGGFVTSGTASFRAICNANLTWIVLGQYTKNIFITKCGLINGFTGIRTESNDNSLEAVPTGLYTRTEIDHPFGAGLDLQAGYIAHFVNCWISSCFDGNGVQVSSTHKGGVVINGGRYGFSAEHGIFINGSPDTKISRALVFVNGFHSAGDSPPDFFVTAGTFHDIIFSGIPASNGFTVVSNSLGFQTNIQARLTGHGIAIAPGANNYTVLNNMTKGHVGAMILNLPGIDQFRVVGFNSG